ncbi:MAG: hypothetical protein ACRD3E_04980 [Terriglobales bacterium]
MNEAVKIGIHALEVLFFGGLVGSAVLVLITAVEDVETVLSDEAAETAPDDGMQD